MLRARKVSKFSFGKEDKFIEILPTKRKRMKSLETTIRGTGGRRRDFGSQDVVCCF